RAPSFDRICFSSNGRPGNARATEPVATITWVAVRLSAFLPVTLIFQLPSSALPSNAPTPEKNVTLFFLNKYRIPSLFCLTTVSLRPIRVSSLSLTLPTSIPCSAKWWLACSKCSEDCSKALDGMQPTLVQVPPGLGLPASSVQASI